MSKVTIDPRFLSYDTDEVEEILGHAELSLPKADTAYQKPQSGIPATDLESSVQNSLDKSWSDVYCECSIYDILDRFDQVATQNAIKEIRRQTNGMYLHRAIRIPVYAEGPTYVVATVTGSGSGFEMYFYFLNLYVRVVGDNKNNLTLSVTNLTGFEENNDPASLFDSSD